MEGSDDLMGLLHRLRRRRRRALLPAGRRLLPGKRHVPVPTGFSARRAALLFVLMVGVSLFWLAATPARAIPPSPSTNGGGTTGTTAFKLSTTVQSQVDALTAQAQQVEAQIEALNVELEQKSEEYNKCVEDLAGANARLSELRRKVADAQADKARRQALLAERIKSVYMSGGRDQLLQLLVVANGLDDLYNRVRLVATMADQDQHLVSDLKESGTRLDLLLQAADQQKRQELQLQEQLTARAEEIQATIAERDQTLAGLDARVAGAVEQERLRKKEEEARLQRELEAKLAAEAAAAAARAAEAAERAGSLNGGQVYSGPIPHIDDEIQRQVVETAVAYMGFPYVWGGSKPSTGMDCSGFVRYVLKQHGVTLPHYSGYMAQMGFPVNRADLRPGDLLAFGFPVHHVGIYIGDGLYIHTPDHVKISKLSARNDLTAIRRFPLKLRVGPPLFD